MDDAPIPLQLTSVRFRDGTLGGTAVMVAQDVHHWRTKDEYYQRENFTTPEDPRNLQSEFVLVREGYRTVKNDLAKHP